MLLCVDYYLFLYGGKVADDEVTIAYQSPVPVRYEKAFPGMYPIRRGNVNCFVNKELNIEFDGTGYVQMGSINTEDESYCAEIEVYADGKLVSTMSLPKAFTKRCQEIFWIYELNSGHHYVTLRWLNPRPDVKLHCAAFVAYDTRPEMIMDENNTKEVLSKMTVEEKVRTVVGTNLGTVTPPDCPPQAFASSDVKPAYAFGYGLSYTFFDYSDFKLKSNGNGRIVVSLKVTNTGKCAGREAVQIYVDKPDLTEGRPSIELCAYAKTSTIEPGKSETLIIEIPDSDLAQFNPDTEMLECAAGQYTLYAAAASNDIRASLTIEK